MRRLPAFLAAAVAVVSVSSHPAPAAAQTGIGRLFACDATGNKQEGGAAIGAVLGGLLGSTVVMTVAPKNANVAAPKKL